MNSLLRQRVRDVLALANLKPIRKPPFLARSNTFRSDARVLDHLGPGLRSPTVWSATQDPVIEKSDLAAIFLDTPNVHKWPHYFPVYERTLGGLRNRPIRFLEIGVGRGGSLSAWKRYFDPGSTIVGIDVNTECRQYDDPARNIHVRIGGQQDAPFLRDVVAELGPFDAILDDGSHVTSHMIDSFRALFAHGLKDGGFYLVEDTHTNYWASFRDSPISFIDFACGLAHLMHAHYVEAPSEEHFRLGGPKRSPSVTVPSITPLLDGIEFQDSMVVIRRARGRREVPFSVHR